MEIIAGEGISFRYPKSANIFEDLSFVIKSGKLTVILGKNGCGKSTLVRLISALQPLTEGHIFLNRIDISSPEGMISVRQRCGIVFQNPDNQFVSPVVEDDIRFGLENHKIPQTEHESRIREALTKVDLSGYKKRNIASLSGGQKQRAAAAGILALQNDILIFDEATAMLDPQGREDMLRCIENLRGEGKTIIMITQNIRDAVIADTVILMNEKQIVLTGSPREVLSKKELLEKAGVSVPFPVRIYHDLKQHGIILPFCPITNEELAGEICSLN